jgi:hypothetical protein
MMDYMDAILGLQAAGWHCNVCSFVNVFLVPYLVCTREFSVNAVNRSRKLFAFIVTLSFSFIQ